MHKGRTKPCSPPEDGLQRDEEGQEATVTSESGSGAQPPGRSSPDGNANGEETERERERRPSHDT